MFEIRKPAVHGESWGKPSSRPANRHAEQNDSQPGSKLSDGRGTTNKRPGNLQVVRCGYLLSIKSDLILRVLGVKILVIGKWNPL